MSLKEIFDEIEHPVRYIMGTKFAFEDIKSRTICHYVFEGVQFDSIDFTGVNFEDVTFTNCTFKKMLFCKDDLHNVTFERCKIFETDMTYATGRNIIFDDTVVQETDFSSTTLFSVEAIDSTFDDCYCHHSLFIDSRFAECTITCLDSISLCFEGTEIVKCENINPIIEEVKFRNTIIRR